MISEQQLVDELERQVQEALADRDLPSLYFNGFVNTMGSGDVMLVLKRGNRPVAVLNTSYTVAKTLAVKLGEMIGSLEMATSNTIMTTDEVNQALVDDQE